MNSVREQLQGGDLRSIGRADEILRQIKTQADFNLVFDCLFDDDRKLVMRAADIIEKISVLHPEYLSSHKKQLLTLLKTAEHIELKWHLALLIIRLPLNEKEKNLVWTFLKTWALNSQESRIVRVNALQGLFDLAQRNPARIKEWEHISSLVLQENIPSLKARIRRLGKKLS